MATRNCPLVEPPSGGPESTVGTAASPFDSGAAMIVYVRPGAIAEQVERVSLTETPRVRGRVDLVDLCATTGAQTAQRCVLSELGTTDVRSPAILVIGTVAALDVAALAV